MSTVTLALAKQALMISHTAQDTFIQALLDGAEDWIARHLGVALSSAARQEDIDGGDLYLWPKFRPVTAVTSVTDLETGTVYPALLDGETRIRWNLLPRREEPRWPEGVQRFRVVYTAGYTALPAGVQVAILQLVARAYRLRAGQASESVDGASASFAKLIDSDIAALLKPYRRVRTVVI